MSERREVDAHLSQCSECAARAADMKAASALVRTAMTQAAEEVDFSTFSRDVLARLPAARPSAGERWRVTAGELWAYRRGPVMGALAAAAAVALVATSLVLGARAPTGEGSDQVVLRMVSTEPDSHVAPLVIQAGNGDAIIWLVRHPQPDADDPHGSAQDQGPSATPEGSVQRPAPKGGDL